MSIPGMYPPEYRTAAVHLPTPLYVLFQQAVALSESFGAQCVKLYV